MLAAVLTGSRHTSTVRHHALRVVTRPMQIQTVERDEAILTGRIDGFSHRRLSGVQSLPAVLACMDALRAEDRQARLLCTLDHLGQCLYTSGHAGMDARIELPADDPGYDGPEDHDDPVQMLAWQQHRVAHVAGLLQAGTHRPDWTALAGSRRATLGDIDALLAMNRAPDRVLDDVVYIQRLPVASDDLLIAGLPNGYFADDWSVFDNHAVILRLQARHGYRLFGLGASWLGFVHDGGARDAAALVDDLRHLYAAAPDTTASPAWAELAGVLRQQDVLLLGYTDNFADTLED